VTESVSAVIGSGSTMTATSNSSVQLQDFRCSNFGWRFDKFVNGDIGMANSVFLNLFHQSVSESDWTTAHVLRQVLSIRDRASVLLFSDGSTLLRSELDGLVLSLATDRVL